MYYPKPEAAAPHVSPPASPTYVPGREPNSEFQGAEFQSPEFQGEHNLQPNAQQIQYEFVAEPGPPEERRERRGDALWRVLNERQISMIAFSGTIGNGLFLGSGQSIAAAGPGGAVLCYVLMGTIIASVISCVGEMTALMPVNAPMMEFPRRFLDRGVAFSIGWMYWFAYAVIAADELVAVAETMKFSYDDGTTSLNWTVGENVDNAVWVTVFMSLVVIINMFPVQFYGQLQYLCGCFKLIFIVMLIVLMLILGVMRPRANAYYTQPLSTTFWDSPYSFFRPVYFVEDENGDVERTISGSVGELLAMWTTFIQVMFSYVGMDIVVATAAESRALADPESMKMAARKVNLRMIILYILAVLTASFVVPMTHKYLNGYAPSEGASSVFVIAVVEAGLPGLAHFFNAVFVFSSFTCAINSIYIASRILHTLALRGQTGPEFITRRLRHCRLGVPVRAVLVTSLLMLTGYMGRSGAIGVRLNELSNNSTVSCLIVYATICTTYLFFYKTLEYAKLYGNVSESQAASYDRDNESYPYKSHGQWFKAFYGMVTCVILLLLNGVGAFLENPFGVTQFVSAYISVPVFILLILGYKIRKHGFRLFDYGPEKSDDLSNTVQVVGTKRRDRLEFPEGGSAKENFMIFMRWIWVWMK